MFEYGQPMSIIPYLVGSFIFIHSAYSVGVFSVALSSKVAALKDVEPIQAYMNMAGLLARGVGESRWHSQDVGAAIHQRAHRRHVAAEPVPGRAHSSFHASSASVEAGRVLVTNLPLQINGREFSDEVCNTVNPKSGVASEWKQTQAQP